MGYTVYILMSKRTGKIHIGQTKDIQERFGRHNTGRSTSISGGGPELVYAEQYQTRSEAVKRERFLKSPGGWLELRAIKEKIITERSAVPIRPNLTLLS